MGDDDVEVTVKMQRGTGTDNRDTWTATVSAASVEALDEKINELREHAERWCAEFRAIQPDDSRVAHLADGQRDLTGDEVDA
jgi:hypothetical protein